MSSVPGYGWLHSTTLDDRHPSGLAWYGLDDEEAAAEDAAQDREAEESRAEDQDHVHPAAARALPRVRRARRRDAGEEADRRGTTGVSVEGVAGKMGEEEADDEAQADDVTAPERD